MVSLLDGSNLRVVVRERFGQRGSDLVVVVHDEDAYGHRTPISDDGSC